MNDKHTPTPGRIGRDGSYLWQMDSPSGAGMNLWSGKLSANNGYPEDHAIAAAVLFQAAPDLLEALQRIADNTTCSESIRIARAAISRATSGEQT